MRLGIDAWGLSGDLFATGMGQYTYRLLTTLPEVDRELTAIAYAAPGEPRPAWLADRVDWRPVRPPPPAEPTPLPPPLIAPPRAVPADRLVPFPSPPVPHLAFFPPL